MPSPGRLLISARYLTFLLREFRLPLGVFAMLVLVGGLALDGLYRRERLGYAKACYSVFLMIFMQPGLEFPDEWYLQPAFFLLPIIGLGAVADSVVRLAYLTFARKRNLPEWQRMVASLHRNHVVVVGVGKVGYQIIKGLIELNEGIVAVERIGADSSLLDEVIDRGVPIIRGDGRTPKALEQAGARWARAVILATSDDLTNLDAGLTARDMNGDARIVLRLFDESLAAKIVGAFAMPAISTAQVSAPAFIAAATGRKVYQRFQLAGKEVHLTDVTIHPGGRLVGRGVGEVQADHRVNIIMYQGAAGVDINPEHDVILGPEDTILVIAPMEQLLALEASNRPGDTADGRARPT
jgi:Trk K+ transport system NAD-binding subunit